MPRTRAGYDVLRGLAAVAQQLARCDHAEAKDGWCPVCGARHAPTAYGGEPEEGGRLIESWVQPELVAQASALDPGTDIGDRSSGAPSADSAKKSDT